MPSDNMLLNVTNLKKYFPVRKGILRKIAGYVKAVDDVDLYIKEGETLGLVGESGCAFAGPRTVGNSHKPSSGDAPAGPTEIPQSTRTGHRSWTAKRRRRAGAALQTIAGVNRDVGQHRHPKEH